MKISVPQNEKPNFPEYLFWDFDYSKMDWTNDYTTVMERVLERGTEKELEELERFYLKPAIIHALQHEIKFLPDHTIEKVCKHYSLKKGTLLCYKRKQSRKGYWI